MCDDLDQTADILVVCFCVFLPQSTTEKAGISKNDDLDEIAQVSVVAHNSPRDSFHASSSLLL